MKTVKISLAVIVVAAITTTAIWGFMKLINSEEIQLPQNQSIKKIEQEIVSLAKMPESSFCKDLYEEVKYYIEDDYSNNRLGSNKSENDQWKKILSSNLYAAYTDKFIKQAFYIFRGSEWGVQKLNFIRTEYQAIQREGYQTGMLEKNSITDKKLNEIKTIFAKYDEIVGFINSCKTFSFSDYDDLNTDFPIIEIEQKIIRSKVYLKNNLENNYVKNCLRVKTNLSGVPQLYFKAHISYLDNKIDYWSGKYVDYNNQRDYSENIYTPLLNEIYKLDNNIYNLGSFDSEYDKLINKLQEEGNSAFKNFE